jgi:EpsI family protein
MPLRALNRHLLVLLLLTAATRTLIAVRPNSGVAGPLWPATPPVRLGAWQSENGAPERILPSDQRAALTLRRTYRSGAGTIWVAVAYYPFSAIPTQRPDVTLIAPDQGVARVTRQALRLSVNGARTASPPPVNLLAISRDGDTLFVAYWYRFGDRIVPHEYELRLRLLAQSLRGQPVSVTLVRVASVRLDLLHSFLHDPTAPAISLLGL